MAVHWPGAIWSLRKPGPGRPQSYVQTKDEQSLWLTLPDPGDERMVYQFPISRKDARLLAKRINQCLDATRS